MSEPSNLYADIPDELPAEIVAPLLATETLRIERIVSLGHASPEGFWYDQDADEWVLLLKGAARLTIEGAGSVDLVPGSFVHLPAHRKHRVEWTDPAGPTIWLAVHFQAEGPRVPSPCDGP